MLNISNNRISQYVAQEKYPALVEVENKKSSKVLLRIIYWLMGIGLVVLFLPWTQNIRSNGEITTLRPDQRPQALQSIIAGRIERWYVQEGDLVNAGDTLLQISEIKDAYFDTELINRTQNQVAFKTGSVEAYNKKIETQQEQQQVLNRQRDLKLAQLNIKIGQYALLVQNDSISYEAAKIEKYTAQIRLLRQDSLFQLGLKSRTDLESRNLKYQAALAKETAAKNKWQNSLQELQNLEVELSSIRVKFDADLNKVQSDLLSTMSLKLEAETTLSKLKNKLSNYQYRNGLYYITAPQSGFVTKTTSQGIGETIKEGQEILTLMPSSYDMTAALYIDPIDLPLIQVGEEVQLQFDGWPAIVFSGWPGASQGTYSGKIYAIDQFISPNGKYRLLIQPDEEETPWPEALRVGGGVSAMILLNDVPIWYELWRQTNGFPPEFYQQQQEVELSKTEK